MNIVFLGLPLSVNKAYATDFKTKRRFKTKDYSNFQLAFKTAVINDRKPIDPTHVLMVEMRLYGNWRTLNGSIRKVDIDNFTKTTLDTLCWLLNFDDAQVFDLRLVKIQTKDSPRTEIDIHEI